MKVEIISIGSEILSGYTVNTNASFLSQKLKDEGFEVVRHTVLPDSQDELTAGLEEALKRSEIIVTTGGLGPTQDDISKSVIAKIFALPLEQDKGFLAQLKRRFGDFVFMEELALLPKGAILLNNSIGTAPGFVFKSAKNTLILLPGVPKEMEEMFLQEALPYLEKHFPKREILFQESVCLTLLKEVDVEPFLRQIKEKHNDVAIGIYPSFGSLRVTFSLKKDKEKLLSLKKAMEQEFYSYTFAESTIEEALHSLLIKQGKKVAFAESCSGGKLATKVTALADASTYFWGSLVTYSNDMKEKVLRVSSKTLQEKGAVSEEVVIQMVEGLFQLFPVDYAVATSGVAGPAGGSKEKPVGTVCIAVGKRGEKIDVGTLHFVNNRALNIEYTANFALGILYRRACYNKLSFSKPL